eukprot:m.72381 g.72381  ORF g.72381 m.72381 type:complete len:594 (+) comp13855_c1_seq3:199-1980(+)
MMDRKRAKITAKPSQRQGQDFLRGVNVVLTRGSYESTTHARRRMALIQKAGGECTLEPTDQTNVVLCSETAFKSEILERIQGGKDLNGKPPPSNASWVTTAWLHECLKTKALVAFDRFTVRSNDFHAMPNSDTDILAQSGTPSSGGDGQRRRLSSTHFELDSSSNAGDSEVFAHGEDPPTLIARSRRVAGTSPLEIELDPAEAAQYFCYNCGSTAHGAAHCQLPPRGTEHNSYVPPFKGARRSVSDEWICARSHGHKGAKGENPNEKIITLLEALQDTYSDYTTPVYQMKALQLAKALTFIRRVKEPIISAEQVRALPNVGQGTAQKVEEILTTGKLQRLEQFDTPEKRAQHEFGEIFGIGAHTAKQLVAKGYRTLEDLLQNKHELSERQLIGVQLHQELQQRIPREEVDRIAAYVKRHVLNIEPDCIFETCGSYRRGKKTCGDIDFLISHRNPVIRARLFDQVIDSLLADGFLTHELSRSEGESTQSKFLGIGKLKDSPCHRRVDIIVVPWEEWPCAVLYFTGSAHFNRSMRLLARKTGWYLSQHCINWGVIRDLIDKDKKLGDGKSIPVKSEHDIFALLALKYRPPWERNA